MRIVKAGPEHIDDCLEAVTRSGIGEVYFTDHEAVRGHLLKAAECGELNVALDGDSRAAGFARVLMKGTFGMFPYLSLLAVREDRRGQGVGTALLDFFEENGFAQSPKVFLLVSGFNTRAQALYKSRGYTQIGLIPSMSVDGVDELIMMKVRP